MIATIHSKMFANLKDIISKKSSWCVHFMTMHHLQYLYTFSALFASLKGTISSAIYETHALHQASVACKKGGEKRKRSPRNGHKVILCFRMVIVLLLACTCKVFISSMVIIGKMMVHLTWGLQAPVVGKSWKRGPVQQLAVSLAAVAGLSQWTLWSGTVVAWP